MSRTSNSCRDTGMETLTIRETARRVDEGEDLVIHSTPVLDFPGGSKFTTASCLRLSPAPAGCLVRLLPTG